MHKRTIALIAGLGLAAAACKDSTGVGDLNNVSAEALSAGLTRSSNQLLVTGMLNSSRGELDGRYLVFSETMARDFYRLDNAENRYITELIGQLPADYSAFTGGGAFTNFYVTLRSGNTILNALPSASGMSAQEITATKGFVELFKAFSYYRVLETRDSLGIAFDVNHPIDDPAAPFICKPNALAAISALLDTAITNLGAGGAEFPFVLPSGFSSNGDFTTPAAMQKVAYGLKGKVELYRGLSRQKSTSTTGFNNAIAALNASFTSRTSSPNTGIYNTFSTAANETTNPLADANIFLNPWVGDSIQAGDLRAAKIFAVAPKTLSGVTGSYKSVVTDPSGALTRPIAIMKNAELLLLRAQAEVETGDFLNATADVNAVRTQDGGLTAYPLFTSKAQAIAAILYEKRYSLLGESAQRLVDLRAYGMLGSSTAAANAIATYGAVAGGPGAPGDIFQSALPIPKSQLDARGVTSITPDCP